MYPQFTIMVDIPSFSDITYRGRIPLYIPIEELEQLNQFNDDGTEKFVIDLKVPLWIESITQGNTPFYGDETPLWCNLHIHTTPESKQAIVDRGWIRDIR